MELLALGVSHKTAPLALRERLALPEGRATAVLAELRSHEDIHEAVAISTCNRTELYLVVSDAVEAESAALAVLARQAETRPTELTDQLYSLRDREAVRHLFSVAAGLDSMIVGEAEIQGQVKRAYELALVEGATGPISNRLFREALGAGKRVRTETGVGRSRVSVSSVAVELAGEMLGDLSRRRVLVIGAGENGELTAKALREHGVHTVFVANRRYDRAIGLAQRFGGSAVRFDDLPEELARADIVVSCTASPHQIVGREELELTMSGRDGRPLVLIDIAVPRDVDPAVRDLPGIALYRHGRPPARGGARAQRARGGGHARPHSRRGGGRSGSTAGSRASTWCPPSRRCESEVTPSWRPCWRRTRLAGSRSPTPTASACASWRARSWRASCTSPRCA